MNEITFENFIDLVKSYNPTEVEEITRAYQYAKELHKGQYRESGEEYIIHPLNVAYILAEMHADKDTVCAGLLHDVIEDTKTTYEDIEHDFNKNIADLVDGVTKLAKMNYTSKDELYLANTRKIITSITDDVRIIIIKLADRLHNMRTLEFKSPFKQKENALETLDVFAPSAYYIGAYRIKSELEDLSFRYLKPDEYSSIEEQVNGLENSSRECLQEMLHKIKFMLESKDIPNEIKVRTKNIYGIYKKLSEGNRLIDIHDLVALKVMVDSVEECYLSLGIIHKEYHPVNNKFKDYICNPKTNMYRSLHTTVFAPNETLVQTQIRTFDMDRVASFGLTAYWDINKGEARHKMQRDIKSKYQFFQSLSEINAMFSDNKEFVKQVKNELFADKVYVYNTKGNVIELPKGSTIIDFAYHLGEDVGNTMVGAVVNDEYVPYNYILVNKDRVKILSDSLVNAPKEDWESIAQTTYAKRMIIKHNESKR